jgi:hypothetical protein
MKIKLSIVLFISMITLCFTTAKAQTSATEFTPAHLHAAERMLEASGVLGNMQKMFASVIQNQALQVPEDKRAAFTDVMKKFFAKYVTDEEIKKDFIPIYATEFSEQELNQIADFLLSPAGKAMTAKQPELMSKGMLWGQKIGEDHKQELEDMMKAAFNEK